MPRRVPAGVRPRGGRVVLAAWGKEPPQAVAGGPRHTAKVAGAGQPWLRSGTAGAPGGSGGGCCGLRRPAGRRAGLGPSTAPSEPCGGRPLSRGVREAPEGRGGRRRRRGGRSGGPPGAGGGRAGRGAVSPRCPRRGEPGLHRADVSRAAAGARRGGGPVPGARSGRGDRARGARGRCVPFVCPPRRGVRRWSCGTGHPPLPEPPVSCAGTAARKVLPSCGFSAVTSAEVLFLCDRL